MSPFSAFTARRGRHLLRGVAILSATVLACSLVIPDAQAGTGACTSEPIWHLSNGATIDTTTNISDSSGDVQSVNYSVKLPSGVSVQGPVVDNAGILSPQDHYSYNSGTSAGSYSVSVQVKTGNQVHVTASTTLVDATGAHQSTADGHSSQQLSMSVP